MRKYASPELIEWFEAHPRLTRISWFEAHPRPTRVSWFEAHARPTRVAWFEAYPRPTRVSWFGSAAARHARLPGAQDRVRGENVFP